MAAEQLLVVVIEVQAAAFAVAVHLAVGTLSLAGPGAVAELLEALLPNLPDVVAVDIALREIAADTGAARDIAIAQHRHHLHAGATVEELVAHLPLIVAQEALAGVTHL